MNTKTNTYRIGELIIEFGDTPGWTSFLEAGGGRVEILRSDASVDRENNVLWLEAWPVHGEHCTIKTVAEVEAALAELPPWTGTRWAIKWDNFNIGSFLTCPTGHLADLNDPETTQALAKIRQSAALAERIKITIKSNNCAVEGPCPICKDRVDPDIGPTLFLGDTWSPVCELCTERYRPDVFQVWLADKTPKEQERIKKVNSSRRLNDSELRCAPWSLSARMARNAISTRRASS
jgi:hypothetical protein